MKNIKILALTGIRSEYDIIYPVLKSLNHCDEINLKLVVSGAHLSNWHGNTLETIKKDGFEIADCLDSLFTTDRATQRAKALGLIVFGLSQTVEREKPDFIYVDGDREESLAAAIVGNYHQVLVVHAGGGDTVYGNADDTVRFAVSKLAHIHLPLIEAYAKNIKHVGEEDFRVFTVGNPALDNIANIESMAFDTLKQNLAFDIEPTKYLVLLKHPLSSESQQSYEQMKTTMEVCEDFCKQHAMKIVGIYPNTDPGSAQMIKVIEEYKDSPYIKFFKTLHRDIFVNVLRNARCLVGNSSLGLVEAPFYELPVVNVGARQLGRINAGNVEFVDYNKETIFSALHKACFDESYRHSLKDIKNYFGDGHSADKIRDILLSIDLDDNKWYIKKKLC